MRLVERLSNVHVRRITEERWRIYLSPFMLFIGTSWGGCGRDRLLGARSSEVIVQRPLPLPLLLHAAVFWFDLLQKQLPVCQHIAGEPRLDKQSKPINKQSASASDVVERRALLVSAEDAPQGRSPRLHVSCFCFCKISTDQVQVVHWLGQMAEEEGRREETHEAICSLNHVLHGQSKGLWEAR